MPELPDVEVFRRRIARGALHRRIRHVSVPDARLLRDVSASTLRRRLAGHPLTATRRHGKLAFVRIGGGEGWLLLHFGMTGDVRVLREGDEEPAHGKLRLDLAGGRRLVFTNPRTFGRIGHVDDPDAFIREQGLGPDALLGPLRLRTLREQLAGRRGAVKGVLMDQSVLAGLGNVYTDEILFQTGLHPRAPVERLRDATLKALHRWIRRVLEAAIRAHADPEAMPRHFLLPHRQRGGTCPRCGRRLRHGKVSGRTTWHCPHDQRRRT